jgi:hypothetical protein
MYSNTEFDDTKKHFFAQNLDSISRNGFLSATTNSSSTSMLEKPLMAKMRTIGYTLYRRYAESD